MDLENVDLNVSYCLNLQKDLKMLSPLKTHLVFSESLVWEMLVISSPGSPLATCDPLPFPPCCGFRQVGWYRPRGSSSWLGLRFKQALLSKPPVQAFEIQTLPVGSPVPTPHISQAILLHCSLFLFCSVLFCSESPSSFPMTGIKSSGSALTKMFFQLSHTSGVSCLRFQPLSLPFL